ncbi:MAG: RNA polymerase sigma factor [Kiritimatiellae bacterium]|nr:RNA polymerase sigma factor [Kiritimatiellia bacterium]
MTVEEHYNALAPKLTNWLVATGSPYNDACDLVQDVFAKLWKMRDDLRDNDSAVSGLAFTMARNLRKNRARDDRRLTFVEEITDDDSAASVAGDVRQPAAPGPSDAAYLRRRLTEAFARLPPILREAYTLFQIGELSVREIAHETGVSEGLVKVRIFRAKEKLRDLLADLKADF